MPRQRHQPTVDERSVKVEGSRNLVVARATGHTWIALVGREGELARDQAGGPETSFGVGPGAYMVRTDGKLKAAEARTIEIPELPGTEPDAASLRLTSDATDEHPVDGVAEVPADGESYATITVEKLDAHGEPLTRRRDNDEVFVRTTGGSLQDEHGKPIRSVKLSSGRATFRLVSEPVGRLVTVEALGQPPLAGVELRLEFV